MSQCSSAGIKATSNTHSGICCMFERLHRSHLIRKHYCPISCLTTPFNAPEKLYFLSFASPDLTIPTATVPYLLLLTLSVCATGNK